MCSLAISEIRKGKQHSIEWHIKNWASDFEFLKDNAKCTLTINDDVGSSPVELVFYFKSYADDAERPNQYKTTTEANSWLSLCATVNCSEGLGLGLLKIITVDVDNTNSTNPANFQGSRSTIRQDCEVIEVQQKFIHLQQTTYIYDTYCRTTTNQAKDIPKDAELRFKISVTISNFVNELDKDLDQEDTETTNESGATGVIRAANADASLSRDLSIMYGAEDNFSDLKLETLDDITLGAHRFILAARSPVFRKLIEDQVKKNNVSGTLKLPTVTAKPLIVILHWMYTGNLHENLSKAMVQVVEICKTFEIPELLKILDKKLITVCSTENMLQLFEVAKQNNMKIAREAISEFIKKNIDKA